MAYKIEKINPLDFEPAKAIGVSLPFSGRAVFNLTYQSKDAIKTNLLNYFLTGRGERFMNPLFGNGLRALLFDQLTENKIKEIEAKVREDLRLYFPKVNILALEIVEEYDGNLVQFLLKYEVRDTNIEDELIINFEN